MTREQFETAKSNLIKIQNKLDHDRRVNQVELNKAWENLMLQEPKELPPCPEKK